MRKVVGLLIALLVVGAGVAAALAVFPHVSAAWHAYIIGAIAFIAIFAAFNPFVSMVDRPSLAWVVLPAFSWVFLVFHIAGLGPLTSIQQATLAGGAVVGFLIGLGHSWTGSIAVEPDTIGDLRYKGSVLSTAFVALLMAALLSFVPLLALFMVFLAAFLTAYFIGLWRRSVRARAATK